MKNISNTEEHDNNIYEVGNNVVLNEKHKLRNKRDRKSTKDINEGESQSNAINKVVRQRDPTKWTNDLHAKFMEVVQQLGEGRCYPKKIFELMQVPGLTKIQIGSHLQKCRRNNWRSPKEQRYVCLPSGQGSSNDSHEPRSNFPKYGAMPRLQTNVLNLQCNPDEIQKGPEFSFSTPNINNSFARRENSIQQQFNLPQLQVQPHSFNIDNPFNDSFLLDQNNVGGGLQHETLFGISGSQELQGSINRNTNYRPGLTFNSGDHDHAQCAYNLNLNATYGATYSSRRIVSDIDIENVSINQYNLNVNADNVTICSDKTMMSTTYVGNAAINGLGATNTNVQQYIGEPNISGGNIIATLYESDIEGRDPNEKEDCEAYYNNTEYLL
ncbi:uncharacterized protein LOC125870062 [Solanum stenotomum]|uniref:uncharacterized protein LOC125870062 n=1 Tax=Solanum stenotomum TaxID=172797 RepID=UPI0020D093E8|nr:uncharacterized protein LOC125870062 [Solanum stenotomum]